MEWAASVSIFLASCGLLYISGELVITNLVKFSKSLGLREFVVAFFVMAFAASLPNFFVGITSALGGVPQLSLGDVFGNNFTALTLAVAVAVLFSPQKEIEIESQTIKSSSVFAIFAAVLPVILLLDGVLSRIDGVLLVLFFVVYLKWLFSRKERFSKIYDGVTIKDRRMILGESLGSLGKVAAGIALVFLAAQGIVHSSSFFAVNFKIPISLVGLLIVGFGNALPEVYFSIASARRGETFMILGNLLGSVIIPATLILGVVALISPIFVSSQSFLLASRIYMVTAALFFLIFARSHSVISRNEGAFLFALYLLFIISVSALRF